MPHVGLLENLGVKSSHRRLAHGLEILLSDCRTCLLQKDCGLGLELGCGSKHGYGLNFSEHNVMNASITMCDLSWDISLNRDASQLA